MKKFIPILLGLVLFALVLLKVDLHSTWELLKHADPLLAFAGLLSFLVMVYIKGIRWSYLLKMQGKTYSVWNCFLIYMGSLFWGNATPGRVGDFIKVFYLKENLKMPMGEAMTSVLVDRVFDLYILLVLGGLGILIYPMPIDPNLIHLVWVFFAVLIGITILAFNQKIGGVMLKAVFQRMMKQEHQDSTNKAFDDFHGGMKAFYKPTLLLPILMTVASYCVFFWGCGMIAKSIGLNIDIEYLAFTISVVNIVSLLTFLGMGTREGALIILFKLISLTQEQALAFSLMLFFIGTLLFSVLGYFCFLLKPVSWKGLFTQSKPAKSTRKKSKKR